MMSNGTNERLKLYTHHVPFRQKFLRWETCNQGDRAGVSCHPGVKHYVPVIDDGNRWRSVSCKLSLSTRFVCVRTSFPTNFCDRTWVKVLVRRSLYTRSFIGLLKFGSGVRTSSIPMFLSPWQPWKRAFLGIKFYVRKKSWWKAGK